MSRVCILGDGGWGTALATVACAHGHGVTVWGPFPDYIEQVRQTRENPTYLPGVVLPENSRWTADPEKAVHDAEVCVLAIPSRYFSSVMERFAGRIPESCDIMSVTKGLDERTHQRMTDVASQWMKGKPVAALSGPSHAEEVARQIPTAVTVASRDPEQCLRLQRTFSGGTFRVYTSDDVIGVELGGALKNVIAIAVGVSDGLGFGDNTRAALITRGLAEMTRLGVKLGARPETFAGLSGMGDLIVTCTSRHSRNRSVGERIGRGERLDDIMRGMKQVAEGIWNCARARALARQYDLDMPVTEEVCAIVHEAKDPREAVSALLGRRLKHEHGTPRSAR